MVEAAGIEPDTEVRKPLKTQGVLIPKVWRPCGAHADSHSLHRLRGTFATMVLRGEGDLESLREVLGHSVLSVTAEYFAATSKSKRRAVQGLRFSER